jgi:hypothetical protein
MELPASGEPAIFRTKTWFFANVLAELEVTGDAMRYVDAEGRIAWKATPCLRDYLMDLQLDAEAEFEAEDV